MIKNNLKIDNIPSIVWGSKSSKVFIAVHGNMSHKEDTVIQLLANEAIQKGYQVISFDLPEHGERKNEDTPCKVQFCIRDLTAIMNYACNQWEELSLFACSMGAYFSLIAYQDYKFKKALFLSPVVDMERIISNMMQWFQVTPERLQEEKMVATPVGQNLYWDYYYYVKEHPIHIWNANTNILYGVKDDLCEFDTIEYFTEKFHCDLEIMELGEHYFHTEEQLAVFTQWLHKHIE